MTEKEQLQKIYEEYADTSTFGIPEHSGVYFVCIKLNYKTPEHILYIGSSQNIRKRIMNKKHPYYIAFQKFNKYFVYTRTILCDNYFCLEKQFIRNFRPLLNKHKYDK